MPISRLSGEPLNAPMNGEPAGSVRALVGAASSERVGGGAGSSASAMVAPASAGSAWGVACSDGMPCSSVLASRPAPATASDAIATAVRGQRGRRDVFVDARRASSSIVIRRRTPA
jgi:hypothetical protein